MDKALAKHGVSNAKYVERTGDNKYGTEIKDFPRVTNIGLTTKLSTQDVYADNQLILRIPTDQGEDGQLGSTSVDTDFELATGMVTALDDGTIAVVKQTGFKRMALYYEVTLETDDGAKVMKVWALNATFNKPNETNATDTNQATLNNVVYPFTVYGEDVMAAATGTEKYKDVNGIGRNALRIISMPGDSNYANFEKTVPKPVKAIV